MKELYVALPTPEGKVLEPCPVCGATPAVWQYLESDTSPATKAVMCSNAERFGPQDGLAGEGCLLYMPPDAFYRATIREAIKYWNEYAEALNVLRRANNWKTHSATRQEQS